MPARRTVEDWRRAVYGNRTINDGTRVLLLWLSDRMRVNRDVSVPRSQIARALDISERRVSERVTAAHEAGFLMTKVRGQKGRTAVYQGLFPDIQRDTCPPPERPFSGTPTSTLMRDPCAPPETTFSGTPVGPTNRTAERTRVGTDCNGSSNEESAQ